MTTLAHTSVGGEPTLSKGRVGMLMFIAFEAIFFCTFVLAYLFYVGKSVSGPQPHEVLKLGLVIINSICLLSSSVTISVANRCLVRGRVGAFGFWWLATILLGVVFIIGTGIEWHELIYDHRVDHRLTIATNLFGTTFYSLVGFHGGHVIVGLVLLTLVFIMTALRRVTPEHAEKIEILSLYWHFVDVVWIVVFISVYVIGR